MTAYYLKFPGDAYALGPAEFRNERAARAWARWFSGYRRLPRTFQVWRADQ